MGYYERWQEPGETVASTNTMDAYRMQEIVFGHAPFLGSRYWNKVAYALLENNLVAPVARSYGKASASGIKYQVDGMWESSSTAARSGDFSRVQVTYDNGLTIVANARPEALRWQDMDLPQYGWIAKGPGLLAYTAMCGGTICDYAETRTSVFANSRNRADVANSGAYAMPSIANVHATSSRTFVLTYNWRVVGTTRTNYKGFLHFVDDRKLATDEGIAFQGAAPLPLLTSQWIPGRVLSEGPITVQIPTSVGDGTYSVRVGLYDPSTDERIPLAGMDDGNLRYVVGYLHVSGEGTKVVLNPVPPLNDQRMNANGAVVNFGAVRTDGMVSIHVDEGRWVLQPFPRARAFTVLLQKSTFALPASVQADGGGIPVIKPVDEGPYWRLLLTGAKSYSWPAKSKEQQRQSYWDHPTPISDLGAGK